MYHHTILIQLSRQNRFENLKMLNNNTPIQIIRNSIITIIIQWVGVNIFWTVSKEAFDFIYEVQNIEEACLDLMFIN